MSSFVDFEASEQKTVTSSRIVFLEPSLADNSAGNGFSVEVQNDAASGTATVRGQTSDSSSVGHSWIEVRYI